MGASTYRCARERLCETSPVSRVQRQKLCMLPQTHNREVFVIVRGGD